MENRPTQSDVDFTRYRAAKRYAPADSSSTGPIDGAATWRMLLKRRRRRLRCHFQ